MEGRKISTALCPEAFLIAWCLRLTSHIQAAGWFGSLLVFFRNLQSTLAFFGVKEFFLLKAKFCGHFGLTV